MKLSSILNEAKQVGILYHYTSLNNALKIIDDNKLLASHADNGISISFTRDKNFLKKPRIGLSGSDIAFVFNGDKLSNKYKIKPNKFNTDNVGDESEERINNIIKIENLKNYVEEVWIFKSRIDDYNSNSKRKMQDLISIRYFNGNDFSLSDIQKKFTNKGYKVVIQ
jgi:hypothetical protein